jgi:DNA-directed RNA polymerase subunit E'/Rpb7
MIITKQLQTTLSLYDDDVYNDLDTVCMNNLKKTFVGKCFMSCFIISIEDILDHSDRLISQTADMSASIHVKFLVKAIIIDRYDLLICEVIDNNTDVKNSIVYASSQNMGIRVNTSLIKVNPYVNKKTYPVYAYNVSYQPKKNRITVDAIPFVRLNKSKVVYYISEDLDDKGTTIVSDLLSKVDEKNKSLIALKKKHPASHKFFTDLMNVDEKSDKSEKADIINEINNIKQMKSGLYVQYNEKKNAIVSIKHKDGGAYRDMPALSAYSSVIMESLQYLTNLETLITTYTNSTEINNMKLIWKVYAYNLIEMNKV